jgi:hypothetical protein
MYPINVGSVEDAIQAAKQLIRPDRTFWFRGQAKNWPVKSSLVRVKPQDQHFIMEKLARFQEWVKHTSGLESLAANVDATVAVAQHYGLPTNFIDFTTKPEIAGFFASEKAGSRTTEDLACIICLDVHDLEEFWQPLTERYPSPEFLEIAVPDLWRLEAQHGCFLFCPYDNIELMYDFDRILFPNTHSLSGVTSGEIYPKRKSNLEILLDQYFMNELMIDAERIPKPEGVTSLVLESPAEGYDPDVFPDGLPEHLSWSKEAIRPWLELRAEPLNQVLTSLNFQIIVPNLQDMSLLAREVSVQLQNDLFGLDGIRSKLLGWHIQISPDLGLPLDFESCLVTRLERLWDGLRRLPYSDKDLCCSLGQCIAFGIALGGDFRNRDNQHWERAALKCLAEPIELEFGADDGSYSRGYVSKASLADAIRPDILSHVADQWKGQLDKNVCGILQTAWTPQRTFDFRLLTALFALEIAPYQVLARNTATFYSPARLVSLGLP